ncbi:MAG: PAS domain-containing protein [Gammaproteobacteria bacterium]
MPNLLSATDSDAAARAFEIAVKHAFHSIMITQAGTGAENQRIVFVNQAFTDMTGYPADEVIGKTPRILQGARTEQQVLGELREKLASESDFHGRAINYRKDGSEFVIEWSVYPVRDPSGSVTHYVAVQHEVI